MLCILYIDRCCETLVLQEGYTLVCPQLDAA